MIVVRRVVTLCAMLGSCHIAWLGSGFVAASSLPVFLSKCVGKPAPYPVPSHPIITFGDSITEGYGATNRCLPT
jgi:hypothetical protein